MQTTPADLDACVAVSLIVRTDSKHRAALDLLGATKPRLVVSDFAQAEFVSAIGRLVRMNEMGDDSARRALREFDEWITRAVQIVHVVSEDFREAARMLRRFEPALRTPDALHLAVIKRLGTALLTFDVTFGQAALRLGAEVVPAPT